MEYIFGNIQKDNKTIDILKTVGREHTDLTDNHEIVRKYPDCVITDVFTVEEKYLSKEDEEGRCYDWYSLAKHYRYTDYFTPQKEQIISDIADTQNALIELDEDRLQAQADLENALCELTTE